MAWQRLASVKVSYVLDRNLSLGIRDRDSGDDPRDPQYSVTCDQEGKALTSRLSQWTTAQLRDEKHRLPSSLSLRTV